MLKRADIEERQAVEQAYENGSQIQYRLNNSDPWKDADWPTFNWYLYDYRVKNVSKRANGYSKAWQHHKGRNPHHYEYWMDRMDDGGFPLPMPKKYAYEMICDYLGAGQAYDPKGWTYEKEYKWWLNRIETCSMAMHPKTKQFVTMVLGRLADKNCLFHINRFFLDSCWDITETEWKKRYPYTGKKD